MIFSGLFFRDYQAAFCPAFIVLFTRTVIKVKNHFDDSPFVMLKIGILRAEKSRNLIDVIPITIYNVPISFELR